MKRNYERNYRGNIEELYRDYTSALIKSTQSTKCSAQQVDLPCTHINLSGWAIQVYAVRGDFVPTFPLLCTSVLPCFLQY